MDTGTLQSPSLGGSFTIPSSNPVKIHVLKIKLIPLNSLSSSNDNKNTWLPWHSHLVAEWPAMGFLNPPHRLRQPQPRPGRGLYDAQLLDKAHP